MQPENFTNTSLAFQYARKLLGHSQKELACELEVNQSILSKIECGQNTPHEDTIYKLEKLTGMSFRELTQKATLVMDTGRKATGNLSAMKPEKKTEYRIDYHNLAIDNVSKRLHNTKNRLTMMNTRYQLQRSMERSAEEDLKLARQLREHLQKGHAAKHLLDAAIYREQELEKRYDHLKEAGAKKPVAAEVFKAQLKVDEFEALYVYHQNALNKAAG